MQNLTATEVTAAINIISKSPRNEMEWQCSNLCHAVNRFFNNDRIGGKMIDWHEFSSLLDYMAMLGMMERTGTDRAGRATYRWNR